MNFPVGVTPPPPIISTVSLESIGLELRNLGSGTPSSGVYPASNRAFFVPFTLKTSVVVTKLLNANGSGASGNLDIGIYGTDGVRIVSAGSTAMALTNVVQSVDVTDTVLAAGKYYLAFVQDGTTGTNYRWISSVINNQMMGIFSMDTAFPLPASATFATSASAYVPFIGFSTLPTTLV